MRVGRAVNRTSRRHRLDCSGKCPGDHLALRDRPTPSPPSIGDDPADTRRFAGTINLDASNSTPYWQPTVVPPMGGLGILRF